MISVASADKAATVGGMVFGIAILFVILIFAIIGTGG